MTHDDLVKRAKHWLLNSQRCSFCFVEQGCFNSNEIPDVIGFNAHGISLLVECKTSIFDFHSDKRKPFRKYPGTGMGVLRYYMTTPGTLGPKNIPEKWGLLYVHPKQVRTIVVPMPFERAAAALAEAPLLCARLRSFYEDWG